MKHKILVLYEQQTQDDLVLEKNISCRLGKILDLAIKEAGISRDDLDIRYLIGYNGDLQEIKVEGPAVVLGLATGKKLKLCKSSANLKTLMSEQPLKDRNIYFCYSINTLFLGSKKKLEEATEIFKNLKSFGEKHEENLG